MEIRHVSSGARVLILEEPISADFDSGTYQLVTSLGLDMTEGGTLTIPPQREISHDDLYVVSELARFALSNQAGATPTDQ